MKLKQFLFIVIIWLGVGSLHISFTFLDRVRASRFEPSGFSLEILYYLSAYLSWSFICAIILTLSQKNVALGKYKTLIIVFFLGLFAWLPIFFIIDMNIGSVLGFNPAMSPFEILAQTSSQLIFLYTLLYTSMFGCCIVLSLYDYSKVVMIEKLELEKQEALHRSHLSSLQMKAFQSQLSPHFLFNSLGSISALARQPDKEAIISAVARLGDMLRFTVEYAQAICIPIQTEMELIDNYIALQKLRFNDRFQFTLVNTLTDNNLLCPPFSLQLLIENAFIHGVNERNEKTDIHVQLLENHNILTFVVINTLPNKQTQSNGLKSGLANLNDRLKMIYGNRTSIQTSVDNFCFKVEVSMPSEGPHG